MQMGTITDKDRERVPSPHSRPGSSEGVSYVGSFFFSVVLNPVNVSET